MQSLVPTPFPYFKQWYQSFRQHNLALWDMNFHQLGFTFKCTKLSDKSKIWALQTMRPHSVSSTHTRMKWILAMEDTATQCVLTPYLVERREEEWSCQRWWKVVGCLCENACVSNSRPFWKVIIRTRYIHSGTSPPWYTMRKTTFFQRIGNKFSWLKRMKLDTRQPLENQ